MLVYIYIYAILFQFLLQKYAYLTKHALCFEIGKKKIQFFISKYKLKVKTEFKKHIFRFNVHMSFSGSVSNISVALG